MPFGHSASVITLKCPSPPTFARPEDLCLREDLALRGEKGVEKCKEPSGNYNLVLSE